MLNLETSQIMETQDIIWLFCMYYECENSETTKKLQVVSLRVPRTVNSDDEDGDEVVNEAVPQLKLEEREDDESESEHSESSSSQASNSNEWVKYTTRSGRKTGLQNSLYDPSTGKVVQFAAVQNYYSLLAELDNEKVELNGELANLYVEYSNWWRIQEYE